MGGSYKNLIDLLEDRAKSHYDKDLYIFLEDGINVSDQISYGHFERKSKIVASRLQEVSKKGDRVILLFPNGIDFIIGLFGCILAGVIAVPAYPPRKDHPGDRFFSILENSGSNLVLSSEKIHDNISGKFSSNESIRNIDFLIYEQLDFNKNSKWADPNLDANDLAILQYTSGSTGKPKGVMLSHANILHNEGIIEEAFGHDEDLIGINWLPNFHDMGLFGTLLQPMFTGGMNVIISPSAFIRNPLNWLKAIKSYKGTTAGAPNFAFEYCLQKIKNEDAKNLDLSSLKVMFCGAEPVRKATIQKFEEHFKSSNFNIQQFYPCYGLAESTLMVTGGDYRKAPVFFNASARALESNKVVPASSEDDSRDFVGSGHPWHETSVIIANPKSMTMAPPGEIGEIWVSGPSVAKGYWDNPEETERTFNAFLKDTGKGPYLRTGDMGFIRDNEIFVSGRLKDLIIIRGTNHYPQDIELTVEDSHQALKKNAGACFSIDLADEERLVLVNEVERTFMRELNAEEVFDAIRMKLAEDHNLLPYAILLIRPGSIPKTSSGKIQRQACKKAYCQDGLSILKDWKMNLDDKPASHVTSLDKYSLRQWLINWLCAQKDLDPASIDPDKPITAYGLDSLLAVNLEKEVNENFGISWPIESFLQDNTINQLVEEGERLLKDKP